MFFERDHPILGMNQENTSDSRIFMGEFNIIEIDKHTSTLHGLSQILFLV
jgi:hypothetical protein